LGAILQERYKQIGLKLKINQMYIQLAEATLADKLFKKNCKLTDCKTILLEIRKTSLSSIYE